MPLPFMVRKTPSNAIFFIELGVKVKLKTYGLHETEFGGSLLFTYNFISYYVQC